MINNDISYVRIKLNQNMKRHLSSQKPCGAPFVPEKLRGYDKHAEEYLFILTRSETESLRLSMNSICCHSRFC